MSWIVEIAVLGAACWLGGWAWTIPWILLCSAWWWSRRQRAGAVAAAGMLALIWLMVFTWTGDRRMYFPYAMFCAVQSAGLLQGRIRWAALAGGGGTVAAFTAVRIIQGATGQVLGVELVVAAIVLLAARWMHGSGETDDRVRLMTAALGSLIALGGLVL